MPPETWIISIAGVVVTGIGAVLTYRVQMRKVTVDYWSSLQKAQTEFQQEVRQELEDTKKERNALKEEVTELKDKLSSVVSQNEKIMLEKLEWMQKAAALQILLQKAMQSFSFNSNESLVKWFEQELSKLNSETEP